jgi:AmiR/NasT family two-component response regulator
VSRSTAETLPAGTPAEAVTVVRTLERLAEDLERRATILQTSLDRRILVEQAKGMLAERFGRPVEECTGLLEQMAESRGVAVHQLASDIVAGAVALEAEIAS